MDFELQKLKLQPVVQNVKFRMNTCLLRDDKGESLNEQQRNGLGTLLNLYGTAFEPRGDPTPFIEQRINLGDNHLVSVPQEFPLYRNTSALFSLLPFSQSISTQSNYARFTIVNIILFIGSSPPSSSSRMNRHVIPTFPVPSGTPYKNTNLTCATLPPKNPLLSPKDHNTSLTVSKSINHNVNKHTLNSSVRQRASKCMPHRHGHVILIQLSPTTFEMANIEEPIGVYLTSALLPHQDPSSKPQTPFRKKCRPR
ncbi:hypothetical protein TNCT_127191 [Trichonephila clavata]|uniref:Uncharacterized protein n=1 Tax=Trichonephila clavata TaxID=2740835 RepID=A0A8X6FWD7_TRICU|nr:hypothetical protein TNCT_127191 [Trichonephila clavata]